MPMELFSDPLTLLAGWGLLLLGYLIRFKQRLNLSGYDRKRVNDTEGLAKWVGSSLILMGAIDWLTLGFAVIVPPRVGAMLLLVFIFVILPILYARMLIGSKKYLKP